jgi:2-polyprenyl-3-methyl-5-hydroxy-6-metoxy-1,4-benzoquinol methylase
MTSTNCYLCDEKNFSVRPGSVRGDKNLKVLQCNDCGLVFLNQLDHVGENHYENSGMHEQKPDYEKWLKDCKRDDLRRLRFLSEKLINKSLLDFGCGVGGFLDSAQSFCKSSMGFELELGLSKTFSERGLNVYNDFNELLNKGLKFNLVTAFHVIEHLHDPSQTLIDLSNLLEPNGEIIVEVPSPSDALLTLYECEGFQNFTYWSQHLYLFNALTMSKLIQKAGLQLNWIKQVQRYPLSNHLHWLSTGKPGGHAEWSFLDSEALNKAYEEQLAGLGLTDTIMAGVSKPD